MKASVVMGRLQFQRRSRSTHRAPKALSPGGRGLGEGGLTRKLTTNAEPPPPTPSPRGRGNAREGGMTYSTILFSNDGGIARLTLNRPERLNSFTVQMHEEVADALGRLEGARVLVLTGAGRGFCAGRDLNDRAVAPGERVDLGHSVETYYNPLIRRITSLPFPVIARVNGVAAGAGANIALACDIVIAAQSAKFIQSFASIGLIPDSGGTWVLPRLIGQARAPGAALTAQPLPPRQQRHWGVLWR